MASNSTTSGNEIPNICPCGGWDCTGSPEGPMYGCPYVAQAPMASNSTTKDDSGTMTSHDLHFELQEAVNAVVNAECALRSNIFLQKDKNLTEDVRVAREELDIIIDRFVRAEVQP